MVTSRLDTTPKLLPAAEDARPRILVTNVLEPNGLFEGEATFQATPITVEAARDLCSSRRVLLMTTQHAYMRRVDDEHVAMLQPHEVGEVIKRELAPSELYQAADEVELPLKPVPGEPYQFLLAGIVPRVDRQSKVLLQIGKPKMRAEVDWSLVTVTQA